MQALFDPARHETLGVADWHPDLARAAIARIVQSAEDEFDEASGRWRLHPFDDPAHPGASSLNLYWGATGVVWALHHLASQGAIGPRRDFASWVEQYPDGLREEAAHEQHGTASWFFGESAALLLAWRLTGHGSWADRLHAVVRGNQHNPVNEPLWGNAGTVLAAITMADAEAAALEGARTPPRATADASVSGAGSGSGTAAGSGHGDAHRWRRLASECLHALADDLVIDPESGSWLWHQDLYGKPSRYLGAGHGLAGNAFAFFRGAAHVDPDLVRRVERRVLETLDATAVRGGPDGAGSGSPWINWHVLVDRERLAAYLAQGGRPFVQDCHGAPGIVCRLAGAPRTAAWDALLRGAGELTWHAGPLSKGPSLCHGTAGSAMACLKLWRRFDEAPWLERARRLALHATTQVELARARHGQGRHSLWTGDLGVACVLWNCLVEDDRFPTLDHF